VSESAISKKVPARCTCFVFATGIRDHFCASQNVHPTEFDDGEPYDGNDLDWIDPRALDDDGKVLPRREMAKRDGEMARAHQRHLSGSSIPSGCRTQAPTRREQLTVTVTRLRITDAGRVISEGRRQQAGAISRCKSGPGNA
jgi:hypothetical protein